MDTAAILELIKETAEKVINPRFRALEQADVEAKTSPDDLVTIADREAEALLASALHRIYPDALVIGEEAVFANPGLRRELPSAEHALVIDPIDGTRNFVKGRPEHGVMLAETRNGITTRGWIWQPRTGRGYVAEKGAGVRLNDEPVTSQKQDRPPLGASSKTHVQGFTGGGELSPVVRSLFACAFDYPRVLHGELDHEILLDGNVTGFLQVGPLPAGAQHVVTVPIHSPHDRRGWSRSRLDTTGTRGSWFSGERSCDSSCGPSMGCRPRRAPPWRLPNRGE